MDKIEEIAGKLSEAQRVNKCHGASDGECFWGECPQLRDNEPAATGRHCPLDVGCPRCGYAEDDCTC